MARFARDLEHQTIRKSQRRALLEVCQRIGDNFGILDRQLLMVQQPLYRQGDLLRVPVIHRVEYPRLNAEQASARAAVLPNSYCDFWGHVSRCFSEQSSLNRSSPSSGATAIFLSRSIT